MKYTVEFTDNEYTETLEINGVSYYKSWVKTPFGETCKDDDFALQLEANGEDDKDLLEYITERIDNNFFASDLFDIYKEYGDFI